MTTGKKPGPRVYDAVQTPLVSGSIASGSFDYDPTFGGTVPVFEFTTTAAGPRQATIEVTEEIVMRPFEFIVENIRIRPGYYDGQRSVEIQTSVRNVRGDGPERVMVTFARMVHRDQPLAKAVREALIYALSHEVDECLRDGEGNFITNPHPGELFFVGYRQMNRPTLFHCLHGIF